MTFVLFGLLRSGNVLIKNVHIRTGRNIALQALFPPRSLPAETSSGVSRAGTSSSSSSRPLGGQGKQEGSQGAPGVVSGGAPSPPTRPQSSERGGSAYGLSSGAGGLAPASPSPSGAGEVGAAHSLQTPLSRASDVVDSPQFSPHVPRHGNSRESSASCFCVLSSSGSQSSDRGSRKDKRARSRESSSSGRRRRCRSCSSSRSRSRGQERRRRSSSSSLSSRARSRRERSRSSDHYRSRRGLDVTGLDPRIDTGHAVTALGMTGLGLLTTTGRAVSVRVPLPAGEGGVTARGRPLSRIARVTARGQAGDYLAPLPACGQRRHDGWPDEKPRRVLRRLPHSLLWFPKPLWPSLLLQEGRL